MSIAGFDALKKEDQAEAPRGGKGCPEHMFLAVFVFVISGGATRKNSAKTHTHIHIYIYIEECRSKMQTEKTRRKKKNAGGRERA